ncbi:MAG: hypothetical protein JWP04_442 [Belnapia sp.]|nr:hypothetical protein [Belnapia sp.]
MDDERTWTRGASWRLAQRLIAGNGAVVTHDALTFAVYGDDPDGGPADAEGTIKVMLSKMRGKFAPGAIRNARGIGYSLDPAAVPAELLARVDGAQVVLALTKADRDAFRRTRPDPHPVTKPRRR